MTPPNDAAGPDGPESAEILGAPAEEGAGASSASAMSGVKPAAGDPLTLDNRGHSEPLPLLAGVSTHPAAPATLRDRPAPAPAPRAVRLTTVRGEHLGQEYPLLPGKNFLGRSTPEKPADIDLTAQERVEQVWASRQHAVMALDGDSLTLEDLNSLNGTFVNRVRLYPGQRATLRPGDVVQVGTVQLRVDG